MKIRKQVYELDLEDLVQYPVWEFALDEEGEPGQDEATVRPYDFTPPFDPREGLMVVRASFILADDSGMEGYVSPPVDNDDDLGLLQPVIVTNQGQVRFWHGIRESSRDEILGSYRLLDRNPDQVFPLKFRSVVDILGGPVEGVLEGFYYYDGAHKIRVER